MTNFNIYHNFYINSSIEKVFDAISQPQLLMNWWPLYCSGIPEIGQEYNFNFGPKYNWFANVIKLEKNKAIAFKMSKSDPDWDHTIFGFELKYKDGKVLTEFSHINWPVLNNHFKHSSYSWAILLKGLKEYIEFGNIMPFHERA